MFLAKITGKKFVKHEHILCEGCGSISRIHVYMRAVCATVPHGMWIGYGWSLCVL
jgi:hypothetical protein